jgi:hypothetical protein
MVIGKSFQRISCWLAIDIFYSSNMSYIISTETPLLTRAFHMTPCTKLTKHSYQTSSKISKV